MTIGDYVVVTGTWVTVSSRGLRDTGGLLLYRALERAVPTAASARRAVPTVPETVPAIDVPIVPRTPLREVVDVSAFNASVEHLNACSRLVRSRQFDLAIAECETATRVWSGNHLAWYATASAYIAKHEWAEARAAAERAVTLRPDQAMYQLYYGMALYEATRMHGGTVPAPPSPAGDVTADPSALLLDAARAALWRATRLDPALWRAHYYLAQVYRELDDAHHAAEELSQTIIRYPSYAAAYIALTDLYRRWDYFDRAIAVAMLGTAHVPAADAADLWYEIGMAHDARRADDAAIAAFGKAIAARPTDTRSKFHRGQIYARKGDVASARRDLEDVVRSTDQLPEIRPIAIQLLAQLAR